jgi:hypothetical protein
MSTTISGNHSASRTRSNPAPSAHATPTSTAPQPRPSTSYPADGFVQTGVTLQTQAERQMVPLGPTQSVNLSDRSARLQLLRGCPQVNPVSAKAGNGEFLCGGAAMTSALVLSASDPAKAKANAAAVRKLAGSFSIPEKLAPAEDKALSNMASGKMSPQDVQHLQQLMFRLAQRSGQGAGGPVTVAQMGMLASTLAAAGAFQGSDVTFHNHKNNGVDHWSCTAGGVHANTYGPGKKSLVYGGPPPELNKSNDVWKGELRLDAAASPPSLTMQTRGPQDTASQYREAHYDVTKYATPDRQGDFAQEALRQMKDPKSL